MNPELWARRLAAFGWLPVFAIPLGAVVLPFIPAGPILHERLVVTAFGLFLYSLVWWLALFLVQRADGRTGSARRPFLEVLFWARLWHGSVLAMITAGAVAGALLFYVVGGLFGSESGPLERIRAGMRDGSFYVFIWAPGCAIIGCIMLAHRRSRLAAKASDGHPAA